MIVVSPTLHTLIHLDEKCTIDLVARQMILFSVFNNWIALTRGPLGIPGIPPPSIFGWTITSKIEYLILAAGFAAFAYAVVWRIAESPFGRVLHAIREDEVLAQSLGKNVLRFKVVAFAVSAGIHAALAPDHFKEGTPPNANGLARIETRRSGLFPTS